MIAPQPLLTFTQTLQLTNWLKYLDYMENKGDVAATTIVYERCLVPCASYPGEHSMVLGCSVSLQQSR